MIGKIEQNRIVCGAKNPLSLKVVKRRKGKFAPVFSNWTGPEVNAGTYGTAILNSVLGRNDMFPYPKSLYNVERCIECTTRKTRDATIFDFFSGSGTTLHATALLNARDGGTRRCILVTNNEVPEQQANALRQKGYYPGDREYEEHGICESVTWPRCKYAIEGRRDDGTILQGEYLNGRKFSEGFDENIEYFRLDFADPTLVERGDAFEGILPILWMIAGAIGERESRRGSTAWYIASHSPFSVLIRETKFSEFRQALRERRDISCVFLVTDSDDNFTAMRRALGRHYRCMQLYKSYLENFRINTVDRRAAGDREESE
jgi:adenine-specific DNA-methyltransferase